MKTVFQMGACSLFLWVIISLSACSNSARIDESVASDTVTIINENPPREGDVPVIGTGKDTVVKPKNGYKKYDSLHGVTKKVGHKKNGVKKMDRPDPHYADEEPDTFKAAKGNVVFYCPKSMVEDVSSTVCVTITREGLQKALDELVADVTESTSKSSTPVKNDFNGKSINIKERMRVELIFANSDDFEVMSSPNNLDQYFDGKNDMDWVWIITPQKAKTLRLSIKISAYDKKNGRWMEEKMPETFDIKVQVDPRGYFAKLWAFFKQKPEWLLSQIVLPFIAFYFGKRRRSSREG
jgi:hypothetical protein